MGGYYNDRPPLGVAILAVLIGIVGAVYLLLGLLVGALHLFEAPAPTGLFVGGWIGILLVILFGVVLLAVASGLWNTELWALVLSIIVVGLVWIGEILARGFFDLFSLLLLVVLVYLIAVHRHFR